MYTRLDGTQVYPVPGKTHYRRIGDTDTFWRPATSWGVSTTEFEYSDFSQVIDYGGGRLDTYKHDASYYDCGDLNKVGDYFYGRYATSPPADYDRCVTEALLKLADGKANMGENLATAKHTAGMFQATALELADALRKARRGQLGDLWGVTKNGANLFLQWKYGWKPLMNDVYKAYQTFSKDCDPALLLTVRRTISSSENHRSNPLLDLLPGSVVWERHCDYRTTVQLTARLPQSYTTQFTRGANQWGLVNPASLAWELVPWSFVVDWFMPIGNILEAFSATVGLDFVDGFMGLSAEGYYKGTKSLTNYPYVQYPNGYPRASSKRHQYTRTLYGGFPSPTGVYWKNPFSTGHGLSALSLLRQMMK
jgi:hypothetical protein